jgi:diadenosine tetraphosphate (Ap4A) HIT family hydrolase
MIAYDEHWRVAHVFGVDLLGWLVLLPRRHVMEVAELTEREADGLGRWQAALARALRDEVGVVKTYVAAYGEAPGFHLHFHVIGRPAALAAEHRGPGIFGLLGTPDDEEAETARDALAERLAGRLNTFAASGGSRA